MAKKPSTKMSARPVDMSKLKFDETNVRSRTEKNEQAITDSVEQFGAARSIVVDADGVIRAGNGTAEAWKAKGGKVRIIESDGSELIAVKRTDLKGERAQAYAIADNRSAELAAWNEGLVPQLESLADAGFDLDALGFDPVDLDDLRPIDEPEVTEDDDVAPKITHAGKLQGEWGTKHGQLWFIEGEHCVHRLLCGDSSQQQDVERLMAGNKADMLLTDPPYGVSYTGKTKDALKVENDDLSSGELAIAVKQWFDQADGILREGSYWYATVPPGPLMAVFVNDWLERGILRQCMVWVKDSMVLGHSEYHYRHEPILFGWKPGGKRHKNTDRTRTTVFEFARPKRSKEHPTMKPLPLWCELMKDGSRGGEIVYEPFCGSGTTVLAAEKLGRQCFGMELSPDYTAVILQRMKDAGCKCTLAKK